MTETDVVVVGSGAAGVGAGLELRALGVPFIVVEAAERVGGRAFTDKVSLHAVWDHGCHWLHSATRNPLVEWADRLGAEYDRQEREDHFTVFTDGRFATADELAEARQVTMSALDAAHRAAERREDVPVTAVLPDAGRWHRALRGVLQSIFGDDPENISTMGYGDYEDDGVDWPVVSGYGDLIARMASDLPVRLGTPVTRIDQGAGHVSLETPGGTLKAKAAIVTAPTEVLTSDVMTFGAGPARDLLDWIADVPLGRYEKVAFAVARLPKEIAGKSFCTVDDGTESAVEVQVVETDRPLLIVHIAGKRAREAALSDARDLAAFARDRLSDAFGADIGKDIVGTATTRWGADPFIRGSYSHAKPGTALRRREMIEADTGNVVFAGEAFSPNWQSTAHGAFLSGQQAARTLARSIRGAQST